MKVISLIIAFILGVCTAFVINRYSFLSFNTFITILCDIMAATILAVITALDEKFKTK